MWPGPLTRSMSRRTLVALGGVALVAAGSAYYLVRRHAEPSYRGPAPPLVTLIPATARYVGYADLAALRASPFFQELAALAPAVPTDPEYAEFVRATGFDYSRDLDRVAFALEPGAGVPLTLAYAEGRFDHGKLSGYAARSGKIEHLSGAEIFEFTTTSSSKRVALAFLASNRVALAGGPDAVNALASRVAESRARRQSLLPEMREHIERVAGSALFVVGRLDPLQDMLTIGGLRSDQLNNLLRSLRWFSLSGQPQGDHLQIIADGECDTPEAARQMSITLDGLRVLAQAALFDSKTRRQIGPKMLPVLESLLREVEVTRAAQRVRLRVELTPEMLRALRGSTVEGSASR